MFDAKFVREHADEIKETIQRQKKQELLAVVDEFLLHDEKWRTMKQEADTLRSKRNELSESVNKAKKAGNDIAPILKEVKEIPAKIKAVEEQMELLFQKELLPRLAKIPNIMHPDVPYGKSEEENKEVARWGEPKSFGFEVKNHVELCEALGIADFDASAKISGNGFYFLKGDLALLNQALIRYATETMIKAGYTFVEPPLMVHDDILEAAMDKAGFEQSIYTVNGEEQLNLIGTAEHALLGMHAGDVLEEAKLPKKYFGYSMCFRKEIGSHGINEKGLWRTHQFNKVEQFIFCLPEVSWQMYDDLYKNSEAILQGLGLPYRVVEICTGDLALWKARSHDFEVWRPTTESYGEVMSLSNCTTYQATNLGIRFVRKNGERGVMHTLNNTALATSRIMVAILENYQEADGSITIPKVLLPFMLGKKKILPR